MRPSALRKGKGILTDASRSRFRLEVLLSGQTRKRCWKALLELGKVGASHLELAKPFRWRKRLLQGSNGAKAREDVAAEAKVSPRGRRREGEPHLRTTVSLHIPINDSSEIVSAGERGTSVSTSPRLGSGTSQSSREALRGGKAVRRGAKRARKGQRTCWDDRRASCATCP